MLSQLPSAQAWMSNWKICDERHHSQIKKEGLTLMWACEKFADYVIGEDILLGTDHKSPVPLLCETNLDNLPPRVLHFRIRHMRFSYIIN